MIVPPNDCRAARSLLDVLAPSSRTTPAVSAALTQTIAAATLPTVTEHALLVLLGRFAQHLGLVRHLEAVPIPQKTVDHRPQTKLLQFLIGILAGLDSLQEFNTAPHPLSRDRAVVQAWGQPAFAHYSGVSRTLAAADAAAMQAVCSALAQVSQPFLNQEVLAIVRSGQPLIIDIDLTGRAVSPTSTSYPDAAFGWMDDQVTKGYQAALSSLSGGPSGRLWLSTQRYDGRAKSADCLRSAVRAVEQALKLRPRRRTALLQVQLSSLQATVVQTQQALERVTDQIREAHWRQQGFFQGTEPLTARQQRQRAGVEQQLARHQRRAARLSEQLVQLQAQVAAQESWLAQLEADNAQLLSASTLVIRLDAGFATDANLAYLIELGYTVLTKVHSGHTTKRLQRGISAAAVWERVGANAEALDLGPQWIGDGRYALHALQVRYRLGDGLRHTTLVYYGDAPPPAPLSWFGQYNRRQIIEAGIKENKAVFSMQRPLVRSRIGMQLQEQFALFAANFVRWAAAWAQQQLRDVPVALAQALVEVKTLVRVVAHSRAQLVETMVGCGLVFDAHSSLAGAVLLICGQVAYQEVLPLFTIGATTPQGVTSGLVAQNLR